MKIAILVGGLPPQYNGGTEIATVNIARYAGKAGHEVHVIAADGTGHADYSRSEDGFKIHRVETMQSRYLHGLAYIPQAVSTVIALKPDLIHAQAMYMTPSALIASKMVGIPYLMYERGGIRQKSKWNKYAYPLLMMFAKRVVAQTETQKQALLEYYQRDIEVIPNGIDTDKFGKIGKLAARQKLGLPLNKKIVLSVGRCRPEKNLACFVKAAKLQPDYQYVLVGDGELFDSLKRAAPENVIFTGTVQNELIPSYMAAADVLVNTSHLEGFPNAFLEAYASGLPVVAPNVPDIPQVLEDGVNGVLTEHDNPKSTVQGIERLLSNTCECSFISAANRAKAKEFTWENVVKRLYDS